MEMDTGTAIALLVAIGGLLTAYFNRKLIRADATEKIANAATQLIEPYVEQVESLQAAVRVLRNQLDEERRSRQRLEAALAVESEQRQELQRGVGILTKQLEAAGLTPGWYPPQQTP